MSKRLVILILTLLCVAGCRDAQHADNDNLSTTNPDATLPVTTSGSNTPPPPSATQPPPPVDTAATHTSSETTRETSHETSRETTDTTASQPSATGTR